MNLQPVLVSIPPLAKARSPAQVRHQRCAARIALRHCAKRGGAPRDGWEKDDHGVPLCNAGFYWSISHKRQWAAAVIADHPVGIDIEHIVPRPRSLHHRLAGPDEWDVLGDRSWHAFYRLWTAKEATLKAQGIGLAGFSACRLVESLDDHHMTLDYGGRGWLIEHFYHDEHLAAVTGGSATIHWHVATIVDQSEFQKPATAADYP